LSQTQEPRCGIRAAHGINNEFTKSNLFDPENPMRFHNSNIAGGVDADEGEFPWQVSLRDGELKLNFCGGVLIDREHILTAAHCFFEQSTSYTSTMDDTQKAQKYKAGKKKAIKDKNGNIIHHPDMSRMAFKVAVGWQQSYGGGKLLKEPYKGYAMKKFGTDMHSIDIRPNARTKKGEVIIHKNYLYGCAKKGGVCNENDIAIVKLKNPIRFNKCSDSIKGKFEDKNCKVYGTFVRPICLPDKTKKKLVQPRSLSGVPDKKANLNRKIKKDKPVTMSITGYGSMLHFRFNASSKRQSRADIPIGCDIDLDPSCVYDAEKLQVADQLFLLDKKKCQKILDKRACKKPHIGKKCDDMKQKLKLKNPLTQIVLAEGQFCAITNPNHDVVQDTCKGDSGGPIVFAVDHCLALPKNKYTECKDKYIGGKPSSSGSIKYDHIEQYEQYQLHGLTSFGVGKCGQMNHPGFYTDIQFYLPWIKKSIDSKNFQYSG